MKKYLQTICILICFTICMCCMQGMIAHAATTAPGDIAKKEFDTLGKAHGYYVGTLGQYCRQCGIPASPYARSGDYGFGIYAHGTMGDAFWIMIDDTHWMIVNGHGDTGDWEHGDSELKEKYSQEYKEYKSGKHPWEGLESFPTKVIHGESLGDIGVGTYSNMPNVTEFYWGGNECHEIDDFAFYDMNKIESIYIDPNIERINKQAFACNPVLKNVIFGAGLQHIGNRAFKNTPISACNFPVKLKSIEAAAFSGCTKLKSIKWGKARCTVGKYAFNNCYGLGYKTIKYVPDYIEAQENSFRNCYGVRQ